MFDKSATWSAVPIVKDTPRNEYENVLIDIWRLIKFHNPASLLQILPDDLKDLADNLQKDYSLNIVRNARDEVRVFCSNKNLTLGIFLEKCLALKKAQDAIDTTKQMNEPNEDKKYSINKQSFAEIKEMLKTATQPLPYNKAFREPLKTKYAEADNAAEMGYKELREHLHEKRIELHNDLASYGQIMHFEDVKNPEARALYYKAWTDGITNEEKARLYQLCPPAKEQKRASK